MKAAWRAAGLVAACLAAMSQAPASPPRAVALLDRYDRGDRDAVIEIFKGAPDVESIRNDLEKNGDPWTAAAGPAREPHRRLVAATMALELANARMRDKWLKLRGLVEWGCRLLRRGPPTEGERLWQRASIAVAEGALDSELLFGPASSLRAYSHGSHAQQRFPADPRIAFVSRFAVPSPARFGSVTLRPGHETGLDEPARSFDDPGLDTAVRKLTLLFNDPEVGAEAALRAGHLQLMMFRLESALAAFDLALQRSQSDYVTCLAQFFRGRTLERQNKPEEAEQAYARALAAVPNAQSPALADAALLMRQGRTDEANAIVAASFNARPRPPDPWRLFPRGDYYRWPIEIAALRTELDR
jgi:tetratricopeptide (TPR) repeat protein